MIKPQTIHLKERRIGIIGLNGSGKSTFTRMINGLVLPSSGEVHVNGYDTRKDTAKVRQSVGYVFQNPANQIVLPVVKDDIALSLQSQTLKTDEVSHKIAAVLNRLRICHLAERRAHELSGGEVQLAALASVLVMSPNIVILDEPTNQLDLKNRNIVQNTIAELPENIIVVTHDLPLLDHFDRVLLFSEGQIIADGSAKEVIAHYRELAE